MNELVKLSDETMSKLALHGDVAGLTQPEKINYYIALCQRVGLDASTQPFKLMKLNGKEVFYLDRSGAQQLNRLHGISHQIVSREFVNGCYVVCARASIGERFTDSLGSVSTEGLKGEAFANATMKAETKAKRRATLDLVGLGMLDDTEIETIPNAVKAGAPIVRQPEQPKELKDAPQIKSDPKQGGYESALTPTPAFRERALEALKWKENSASLIEFFVKADVLLPTESLEDWPLRWVPASKSQLNALSASIAAFQSGEPARMPYTASYESEKPVVVPIDSEPWRAFPIPFGKNAGTKMAELPKNYLFGLWANYKVETEYNGKPKKPNTIAKDTQFREMLDAAGRHYEFQKPEDDEPPM